MSDLIADMESRGFDRKAFLAAVASGDDDAMGTTHPMLWLPEGAEEDGVLDGVLKELLSEAIHETKIEVVVYTRGPLDHEPPGYDDYGSDMLKFIAQDIFDGDKIGDYTVGESTLVPPEQVREKLIAIGNDGDFFDTEDTEEDDGE